MAHVNAAISLSKDRIECKRIGPQNAARITVHWRDDHVIAESAERYSAKPKG